ncbi:hypothetical protein DQ04_08651030 [Trypanosoma grayi]|uniref:hypothetical protein n=1 Tax=Trypanosoma grayi TaxID=71804 RepID=UPI0004F3F7EE|nr:hypothetical protein DQ04_08651030 [Trypanosoma grayi]KEG07850.1 hypothetical protein DQ04_08651030 [Trypanosoma grayi]
MAKQRLRRKQKPTVQLMSFLPSLNRGIDVTLFVSQAGRREEGVLAPGKRRLYSRRTTHPQLCRTPVPCNATGITDNFLVINELSHRLLQGQLSIAHPRNGRAADPTSYPYTRSGLSSTVAVAKSCLWHGKLCKLRCNFCQPHDWGMSAGLSC